MDATIEVKNFGKINSATIQLKDLTVFAGTNNTAKSYVSRALYSILSALKIMPKEKYYAGTLSSFADKLNDINDSSFKAGTDTIQINKAISILTEFMAVEIANAEKQSADIEMLKSLLSKKTKVLETMKEEFIHTQKKFNIEDSLVHNNISYVEETFGMLKNCINVSSEKATQLGYSDQIFDNLQDNFQVGNITSLIGKDKKQEALMDIKINGKNEIVVKFDSPIDYFDATVKVSSSQVLSDVIYFESPIYWKLKRPLSSMPIRERKGRRKYLGGVPCYFHDAVRSISLESVDKHNDYQPIEEIVKDIETSIGGHITLDKLSNELKFVESVTNNTEPEQGISLLLTATGIVQLGMLSFFLKNRIIGKDTTLFYDEPEAHLHPAWQEKVMDALYSLAKMGVNVILATHSPTTLQKLELCLKEDDSPPTVGWNYFDKTGNFNSIEKGSEKSKNDIAESLERPSYNMYLRSTQ